MAVKQGNLHDDAVVGKALHEGTVFTALDQIAVIVVGVVVDINHRSGDVPHTMPQQINGHHRQRMLVLAVLHDVLLARILGAKILAEPQSLSFQPCLLQFYQHHMFMPVLLTNGRTEINAEHRYVVSRHVHILMGALLHLHHLLLQQGRQQGAGDTLVFHQVFEHRIINRVGHIQYHRSISFQLIINFRHDRIRSQAIGKDTDKFRNLQEKHEKTYCVRMTAFIQPYVIWVVYPPQSACGPPCHPHFHVNKISNQ